MFSLPNSRKKTDNQIINDFFVIVRYLVAICLFETFFFIKQIQLNVSIAIKPIQRNISSSTYWEMETAIQVENKEKH